MKFNSPEAIERFKEVFDFLAAEKKVLIRKRTVIAIEKIKDKWWVRVNIKDRERWMPSFEELYYIIKGIAQCEDSAYSDITHQGRHKMWDFLNDALWNEGYTYEELAEKYKLPSRIPPEFYSIKPGPGRLRK